MKDWIYAAHSHAVKELGGPEKYIGKIRAHERQITTNAVNKKWMLGVIPALTVLVPLATKGACDLIKERKQKKVVTDAEAQQAEKEPNKYFEEAECDKTDLEESPCL